MVCTFPLRSSRGGRADLSQCRKIAEGQVIRVYYHPVFDHPVLELPADTAASLFNEMDEIAAKLRPHPKFVEGDLQIAFYQLQRQRIGNLSKDEWLWLFGLWCDHDRGKQVIDDAERAALWETLCNEREALFVARRKFPDQSAVLTARLLDIGRALAELQIRHP